MLINKNLKVERYDTEEGISHKDWFVADCGKDREYQYGYAVVTDHVHASELIINPEQYAKLFAQSPKMYNFIREIFSQLDLDSQYKAKKLLEKVHEGISYESKEKNDDGQNDIYDLLGE